MRRAPLIAILAAGVAGAVSAAVGCSGDDSCPVAPADASADVKGDTTQLETDAGSDAALVRDVQVPPFTLDATAPTTLLRVANWSSDAPAVDFCLAPHGTNNFRAPLLSAGIGALVDAGVVDASAAQLSFPLVSAYLATTPGFYDVRLVAAGSVDCSVGIIADLTNLPQLRAGHAVTLALLGATQPVGLEPALQIVSFLDDTATPTGVTMRVINASVDLPSIDFGVGKKFQPPFLGIPFGAASRGPDASTPDGSTEASVSDASTPGDASGDAASDAGAPPVVDPNGYFPETLSGATLTVRATGDTTPAVVATNVSVAPGTAVTMVVLGLGPVTMDASATALLQCADNAGTVGVLGECSIITP